MTRALVFPGQGAQKVGMGLELYKAFRTARDVFEEVDAALKFKLSKIIFEGSEEDLTHTENTQPALMAMSLAVFKVLEIDGGRKLENFASLAAGHSLGEYSALTAAGALSIPQAARLLRLRGQAMQAAAPKGTGGMAALIGGDYQNAVKLAEDASQKGVCEISNDNAPGQMVLSGSITAIDAAVEAAPRHGFKKAVKLNVSAPFHCSLIESAAREMEKALDIEHIKKPVIDIIANVTAARVNEPLEIKKLLAQQVVSPVRWRESVMQMKEEGITEYVELGSGKVLAGLIKRIDTSATTHSLETPADIEGFIQSL